jgi:hypothetical protein
MPIRIRNHNDPLSPRSLDLPDSERPGGASCAAARIFAQELERYCTGMLTGCSFLISGHRGAGKTTMVESAIDEAMRRSLEVRDDAFAMPLPVFLNGPSLFAPDTPHGARGVRNDSDPAKAALVQVILGLHRAVVQQFVESYRRSLLRGYPYSYLDMSDGRVSPREHAELVAQFEIEILEDPPASRLLEFWSAPQLLDVGVLFPRRRHDAAQGMRELVALNGVCNAHQRISGEIKSTDTTGKSATNEQSTSTGVEPRFVDMIKPLASLAAGTSVATGGALGSHGVVLPALAGLATALGASMLFKSSTSAAHKHERHLDTIFMPDLTLKTLDRVLPLLLHRLRNAGLAPVLVIDELDKVTDLDEKLVEVINFLKKLIAEGAFTCFLTDRDYYERLNASSRCVAYGLEYSYYTHRLLIAFQPDDLDDYLERLLVVVAPAEQKAQPAPDYLPDSDEVDRRVWKWVLRHRSQLHALELARALAAIRRADGMLASSQGRVRSDNANKVGVTLQFALELAMKDPNLIAWERQKPELMQTINDALYYPTRQWMASETELDMESPGAQLRFATYLRERIGSSSTRAAATRRQVGAARTEALLDDEDIERLRNLVQRMVFVLSETCTRELARKLWDEACREIGEDPGKLTGEIEDMLLLGADSLLHHERQGFNGPRLRWRYDRLGTNGRPGGLSLRHAYWLACTVSGLDKALAPWLGNSRVAPFHLLADRLRILPTSPAWPSVASAMESVDTARKARFVPGGARADHVRLVASFWRQLRAYARPLAEALHLGAALGGFAATVGGDERERTYLGLEVLSVGLNLSQVNTPEELQGVLADAATHLNAVVGKHGLDKHYPMLEAQREAVLAFRHDDSGRMRMPRLDVRLRAATGATRRISEAVIADQAIVDAAWNSLYQRALALEQDAPAPQADIAEMIFMVRQSGLGRYGLRDLKTMTLPIWSTVLLTGLHTQAATDTPRWFWELVLNRLGARSLEPNRRGMLDLWLDELLGYDGSSNASSSGVSRAFADADTGRSPRLAIMVARSTRSVTNRWFQAPNEGWLLVIGEDDLKALAAPRATAGGLGAAGAELRTGLSLSEEATALITLIGWLGAPLRIAIEQPARRFSLDDYRAIAEELQSSGELLLLAHESEAERRSFSQPGMPGANAAPVAPLPVQDVVLKSPDDLFAVQPAAVPPANSSAPA